MILLINNNTRIFFKITIAQTIQLLYKHNYGNSAVIEQLEGNLIMLEEVFNGTYKGKTQFCHKGEGTIAAWNDYHSTEYCMVDDYHPIDAYNVAKQALQDRE